MSPQLDTCQHPGGPKGVKLGTRVGGHRANVQGLGALPTVRLERKIGRLSAGIMEQLKDALAFALDLERASE